MYTIRGIVTGALALSLSGISIACCYVFGTHLAPGGEGQLYGVLGGIADALKAVLPLAITAALAAKQTTRAACGVAMFAVFSLYSFTSEFGLYALGRNAIASDVQASKEGYEAAKAERARIASRLKELGSQRPTGAVQADIAAAKQSLHWERSAACERPSWSAERELCAKVERLKGEMASAQEADRLRGQDEKLGAKLAGSDLAAVMRSSDPQSEALARFTGFSAQSMRDALAVLVALLIELGSGLGLWVATAGSRAGQVKSFPETEEKEPQKEPHVANVEASASDPTQPPPVRRKRTAKPRKALAGQSATVIQFRKRPSPEDIRALLKSGQTQRQVAAHFGFSDRTLRRKLSASMSGQMSALMSTSVAAS